MAIYHFSAKLLSRSHGRSSVAAAAYRAAEKLFDARTDVMHDFTRKGDVIDKAILLPENAPDWMRDREKLWNAVERVEKRKDAQLAREITVALPRELSPEQNWDLLTSFVQTTFVDHGMVADVAFHRGHAGGGEDQPHGHVLLTLREVTSAGFGQKVRSWNQRGLLCDWRVAWAEHCNMVLARQGLDVRIDHRTLEAQGINLEPQRKIGPRAAATRLARFAEHQALAQRNGERLLADPEMALHALTRQQSTFTHHDVARFVHRHTGDKAQFDAVYAKVNAHPELVHVGQDDRDRDRFTTRALLALETQLMEQATDQAATVGHGVSEKHQAAAAGRRDLSAEQHEALSHLIQGGDVVCVVGFAGSGKSYLLGAAREAWESAGYRVQGMTLSGMAAQSLESGSGIVSGTVASRLWHWARDRERLTAKDIVVVDEAGMLGSRQLAPVMAEAHRARAKVVLVGDPEQLQAIEAGAAFRAIAERVGFVEMTEIRRQRVGWQRQATRDFARERTSAGLYAYEAHDHVHTFNTQEAAMTEMVAQWDAVRNQALDTSQIMLAYTRDDVRQLNEQARAVRRSQGELGVDVLCGTSRGERSFAEADRIYFLRNDRDLGVKNGTLGTIEHIHKDQLIVRLDPRDRAPSDRSSSRTVSFCLSDYDAIDHGYAATVYKAQGVTVDRTHVLASPYFDRHSTYVAMSRHRDAADLYVSREDFPSFGQLSRTVSRQRSKDMTLDYAQERGFDVSDVKHLKDRQITQQGDYATPLTEERLQQAEKRLAQRQYERAVRSDMAALEKKTGLSYSLELQEGDHGIYRGQVAIAGRRYGVMEQAQGEATLIAVDQLESRQKGSAMVIEKYTNYKGQEKLRAIQPDVRERERTRGRGITYGGL